MESLTEDQIIFLATNAKRLRHCFHLASQHNDDAEAAILDLQQNAFADGGNTTAGHQTSDEPTPIKVRAADAHLPQQLSAKKLYKQFCRECFSHFTPPSLDGAEGGGGPLTQAQIVYLLPATLFSMYLEAATDGETRLLRLVRRLEKRGNSNGSGSEDAIAAAVSENNTLRGQIESLKRSHENEAERTRATEKSLASRESTIAQLSRKITDLEATAAALQEKESVALREKRMLEDSVRRLSDELAASARRHQHAMREAEEAFAAQQSRNVSRSVRAASRDVPSAAAVVEKRIPAAAPVSALYDANEDDDLLIPTAPATSVATAPRREKEAEAVEDRSQDQSRSRKMKREKSPRTVIPKEKRKRGACEKCGANGGERFQCQRCKLRFHEICGGPYAPEENDFAPEVLDRIVDSENAAVIEFLTETIAATQGEGDDYFTPSQFDFQQIDDMRNRRLCQLYCRMCRREQGIISDGSSSESVTASDDDDEEEDEEGWSTDSSEEREREERAALDISRFPATQCDESPRRAGTLDDDPLLRDVTDSEVVSVSSTSSSVRRRRRAAKKERKIQKALRNKLLKKRAGSGSESGDSFIVGGGGHSTDDDKPYRKSRYVLDEARDARSDDSDEEAAPESGLERHKKETANRLIKANHKRRRLEGREHDEGALSDGSSHSSSSSADEVQSGARHPRSTHDARGKRKKRSAPVLDQEDLGLLDLLGLEAPAKAKIRVRSAGASRDDAVEISQSSAAQSPQRPVHAGRSLDIFNTLRHVNPNASISRSHTGAGAHARATLTAETQPSLPHADEADTFWGDNGQSSANIGATGAQSSDPSRLLFSGSKNSNAVGNRKGGKRTF